MHIEVISREPAGHPHPTPLLFIHGAWHGAWCWDEHFLPYFANMGYAAYALSLRGHGQSDGHQYLRWTSSHEYLEDIIYIARQLPRQLPRPPILIGHSLGGWLVQKYLEQHPATAAVLLAPLPPAGPWGFALDMLRQAPVTLLKSLLSGKIPTLEAAHHLLFSAEMPTEQATSYFEQLQAESLLVILETLFGQVQPRKDIAIPVLVLGAIDDAIFSLPAIQATARLQQTQAEAFPHMAHDMMLERNWQRVAHRILAWLQDNDV
jgi:pimeloyl-ACP methyl ester carboxylesterase